jgi:hypothetical protein
MAKKLFEAQSIHLRVLAPSRYYCGAGDLCRAGIGPLRSIRLHARRGA